MFRQICLKRPYKTNKNIKMSSFKSSENIQKKEGGPDRSVSDNQSSSVTQYELAEKAKNTVISSFEDLFLAFQAGCCLLLNKKSSAESSSCSNKQPPV